VGFAISSSRAMISAMVGARSTLCQLRGEDLVGGASRCAWGADGLHAAVS
jgi:hypothetical protein